MRRRRLFGAHRHQRRQIVLVIAALGTAVALPTVLLAVGHGVIVHELATIEASGYQIVVSAGGLHGIDGAHALERSIEGLPRVAAASPILSVPVELFHGNGTPTAVLAEGVVPEAFAATEGPAVAPLFPHPLPLGEPTDLRHFANGSYAGPSAGVLLVSSPLATATGLGAGSQVSLGATPNASTAQPFTVNGTFGVPPTILGPTAAFVIVLPLSDLQAITGWARTPSGGLLDAADTVQVGLVVGATGDPSAVSGVAAAIGTLVPYYGVSQLSDEVTATENADAVLTGFYFALSSVGLAVGLVFLGLVLVRRVESARREIGIQRAIGIPARRLVAGVVGEAAVLAGAGTAAGIGGGAVVVAVLAAYGSPTVRRAASFAVYDPGTFALLILTLVALAALTGAIAGRAIVRLPIPEALR